MKNGNDVTVRMAPPPERIASSSIMRVVRNAALVDGDARIAEVAAELSAALELPALAVVDGQGRGLGILTRDRVFGVLGKPFGVEVMGKRPVSEIAEPCRTESHRENLFHVAERLGGALEANEDTHALVADGEGRCLGSYSTRDLLTYLAGLSRADMELAGLLQDRLVNGQPRHVAPYVSFLAASRYAKGVGGDFHYVREIGKGRWFFTLCDVSGKGAAASIISSMVWGMLENFDYGKGLKRLLEGVNRTVLSAFHREKYLTGIFLVWDAASGLLSFADMGHGHAFLSRGGAVRRLKGPQGNIPLGIEESLSPVTYSTRLRPGDGLLVYSDGITEQEDARGREFGEARLAGLLSREGGASFGERLFEALDSFRGELPQHDDMSFVLMKVKAAADEGGLASAAAASIA